LSTEDKQQILPPPLLILAFSFDIDSDILLFILEKKMFAFNLGERTLLVGLAISDVLLGDGTFKEAPQLIPAMLY
jgi:hypothetical protein